MNPGVEKGFFPNPDSDQTHRMPAEEHHLRGISEPTQRNFRAEQDDPQEEVDTQFFNREFLPTKESSEDVQPVVHARDTSRLVKATYEKPADPTVIDKTGVFGSQVEVDVGILPVVSQPLSGAQEVSPLEHQINVVGQKKIEIDAAVGELFREAQQSRFYELDIAGSLHSLEDLKMIRARIVQIAEKRFRQLQARLAKIEPVIPSDQRYLIGAQILPHIYASTEVEQISAVPVQDRKSWPVDEARDLLDLVYKGLHSSESFDTLLLHDPEQASFHDGRTLYAGISNLSHVEGFEKVFSIAIDALRATNQALIRSSVDSARQRDVVAYVNVYTGKIVEVDHDKVSEIESLESAFYRDVLKERTSDISRPGEPYTPRGIEIDFEQFCRVVVFLDESGNISKADAAPSSYRMSIAESVPLPKFSPLARAVLKM